MNDPKIEQALRRLVDDPEDTAVTADVAEQLASSGGEAGLRLLLSCLAEMDKDGAAYGVIGAIEYAYGVEGGAAEKLTLLVDDPDPLVGAGARWALEEWARDAAMAASRPRRWWHFW